MKAIEADNDDLKDVPPRTYNRLDKELLVSLLKNFAAIPLDIEGDANTPELMNTVMAKIADVADVKGGKQLPKGEELTSLPTANPYIRAQDIRDGKITIEDPKFLNPEQHQKLKRYVVTARDVCIVIVGANVGDVGIVPSRLDGANLTENAVKLTNFRRGWVAEYVNYCLCSPEAHAQTQTPTPQSPTAFPDATTLRGNGTGTPCKPDTRSLLIRTPVVASGFRYIGKETDRRWEQGEDISIIESQTTEYTPEETERLVADPVLMTEASEFPIRALAKEAGVSENTVKALRRGERLRRGTVETLCAALRVLKSRR